MKTKLIDKLNTVITRLINILEAVGKVINQTPTAEEQARIKTSPTQREPLWKKKKESPKTERNLVAKQVYGHKGSSYKGKGNINTDAATFNHPRKDVSQGRRH